MNLKDFVKETIVEICQAITEANNELKGSGAIVNPPNIAVNSDKSQAYGRTTYDKARDLRSRVVDKVEFDVSVVAEAGENTNAGIKISIASIGLNAGGNSTATDKSESRIKFSIPVVFPCSSETN